MFISLVFLHAKLFLADLFEGLYCSDTVLSSLGSTHQAQINDDGLLDFLLNPYLQTYGKLRVWWANAT